MRGPVPVTLLAGFLGSGKTTLLNRLLTGPSGAGVAVIVNEFGSVGVDGRLVARRDEEVIELANGCICCELRGDLREALLGLAARRARRLFGRARFERVVVEASGLAAPGPAVQTFLVDGELSAQFELGAVVTLAHAALLESQATEHPEVDAQLAYADRVLLNHADRADEATLERAAELVRARTPLAEVLGSVRGVPLGSPDDSVNALFTRPDAPRWREVATRPGPNAEPVVDHGQRVGAVVLRAERPLAREPLEMWLRFLCQRRTHEIMRVKGVVRTDAGPIVVQGVHQWLELEPAAPEQLVDFEGGAELVVIGRGLDEEELRRGWAAVSG